MNDASTATQPHQPVSNYVSWFFGVVLFIIGAANLVLVHPVPGLAFLLLSLLYAPAVNKLLRVAFGFLIPLAVKIVLAIVGIWFTLGVSDLGDIIDAL